jgi:AcrR family transcriptional regulator
MTDDVKRGQARTRLARREVVEAARTLFLDRGYASTTVEAVSEHADVPIATVYRLFSSKLGILRALLDASIAGDDQPVAVSERGDVAALFREPNPRKLIAGFAGVTTAINERTNDVYRVLESAAGSDPAAAELLGQIRQQRAEGQGQIVRALARAHALKPPMKQRDAADIVHAVMSPEVYRLLVTDRGWKPERYKHWLAATLTQQLL